MTTTVKLKCYMSVLLIQVVCASEFDSVKLHRHCKHIYPKSHEVIHGTHIEPIHVLRKRSLDQPIRILLWYDHSVYRLDSEKFELINNTILPEAVRFWEKALSVRRSDNPIRLGRKCDQPTVFIKDYQTYCIDTCKEHTMCGEVQVPDEHLDVCRKCNATGQDCGVVAGTTPGPGIDDADFVFYVSAMQTERCKKSLTVAYAAHCQQETALDRPIAGHANLCPDSINTKPQETEILLSTVKHEILHALGFSISLYAFYRDEQGDPLTPRRPDTGKPVLNEVLQIYQWSERVIRTVKRPRWMVRGGAIERELQMIVTPRVVDEVRAFFNCPLLEGAELEDQGEEGTAMTHWEKRVFENEAMTGTHTQNPIISRITLALMEDTGWYQANYSMAMPMSWGRGLGCDFVMNSCKDWIDTRTKSGKSIHPFCNNVKRDPLQTECTDDRTSVALCNLINQTFQLPTIYQNFDSIQFVKPGTEIYFGGSVTLADYCPYIQEFTWRSKSVVVRGSHCQYIENNPRSDKNFALEKYGEDSRCFDHSKEMWEERSCLQVRQWQHWGSGCYQFRCEAGRLHIIVGNYTYTCYRTDQEIEIRILRDDWLHSGTIVCPSCSSLCMDEFASNGQSCLLENVPRPIISFYNVDELKCGACSANKFILILLILTTSICQLINCYNTILFQL